MLDFIRKSPVLHGLPLLLGLTLAFVQGQTTQELDRLKISLWPEFDRPAMLVIYRAELPDSTPLPAQVNLIMPAGSGDPHAVAVLESDGSLLNTPYELQTEGEWTTVTITADRPVVWMEYYADLKFEGDQREFLFSYPAQGRIAALAYEVQQPVDTLAMEIVPEPDNQRIGEDGLVYYQKELGPISAGDEPSVGLLYTRSSETLSVGPAQEGPQISPINEEVVGSTVSPLTLTNWLLLGGLVLLLVGGGAYFVRQRAKEDRSSKNKPKRRRKKSGSVGRAAPPAQVPQFCHNCGTQRTPDDVYCRKCGEKLRD